MKVLHVITTLNSGGAEKMLVDIVNEMKIQGISCEVAVLTKTQNFFGKQFEKLNIPVYYGPTSKVYSIKNIFWLKNIITKQNYNYIHTHLFASQLFMPIALKLANNKAQLITTEHSTHNKRRETKVFYWLDYWLYLQYDKIIAITKDTKKNLNSYLPSTLKKTVVIENGIDVLQYSESTAIDKYELSPEIAENDKLILMVAAMRDQKDHETLIRASKLLPSNYRVIFVGDGERMEEVKQYALEYGSNTILFLGRQTDVPAIMKASDVFVLSSKWEGFGLVAVEAAATGLPVVASDVKGLSEVVNTIGGQVFEPFNEEELAKKIIEAIHQKKDDYNVSSYAIQTTVQKYINLYKESLKE
ncbi:glycosyltransferase [Lysinibacillus fusiformis]|uniref:glycosyltransferase n=1 Tax=Lysinibacillus fusiformis TaxID=28031 RepID=UPI00263A8EA5|nr:glycosyltransferase [Lysinibacillus fusiformis]MDC6270268.1 glycosyltransferase [Lysinibacillus sphaericus]MDN4971679.1 glycosyltransferase [Lysinibacillus fusiformis]